MSPGVAAPSRVAPPETRAYLASDRTGVRAPITWLRWPASTLLRLDGKDEQLAARDPGRTA